MNTRQIEYEILKRLFNKPHCGYDLYVYLELLQLVSKPSQVYKILQRMENQEIIKIHSLEPSKYGRKKKNYTITPNGERSYLKSIIWKFIDLEVLYSTSIMIETRKQIEKHPFYFPFNQGSSKSNTKILFDHSYMFYPQELYEFYDFFSTFDSQVNLYFKFQNMSYYQGIVKKFNKKNQKMQIYSENSKISNFLTYEYIFAIGFGSTKLLREKFEEPFGWLSQLQTTGTFCYIMPNESERGKSDSIDLIFTQFKHEIRRTIKELAGVSFEEELSPIPQITDEEIEQILKKYFKNILKLSIMNDLVIFLCKTWI
ncbi:PadR family transcriptional regulator [Candidatus Lokiarchaeum ossiferum]